MQHRVRVATGVLVALALLWAPAQARACGHGGGGGGGGGHGGGGGGRHGASRSFLPEPVRWPVALALETSVQSLSLASTPVTGWSDHPVLAAYVGNPRVLPGRAMGVGAMTAVGGAVRLDLLFGGHVLLGARFAMGEQLGGNSSVALGYHTVQLSGGTVLETGLSMGAVFPLESVTLRAEVYAGLRVTSWEVQGLANAGCDSPPVMEADQVVVQPRAEVDWNLSRAFSLGAYVSTDVLHVGEMQSGLVMSVHGHPFATTVPAVTPGLPGPAPAFTPPGVTVPWPVAPGHAVREPALPVNTAVDALPDSLG